jgi:hypothetical protein
MESTSLSEGHIVKISPLLPADFASTFKLRVEAF